MICPNIKKLLYYMRNKGYKASLLWSLWWLSVMIVTTAQLILIQFICGLVSLSSSPVDPSMSEISSLLIAFITLLFNLINAASTN